ncbi:MAG: inner-rane translocator [Acidimicrobiales bacterium]|nr:inner-rane translocator [Acidimicrobiales bacterium]
MDQLLDTLTSAAYWDSTLRLATPIVLAALGTLIASRAGVLFVAVEGSMLISTFTAVAIAVETGSILFGTLAGAAAGALTGLFSTWLSIDLRAGDVVAGLVVAVGGLGLTSFLHQRLFPTGAYLGTDRLEALWDAPGDGGWWILVEQQPLVYVSVLLVVAIVFGLRTRAGLRLRSCGESMDVAEGLGISVRATRYVASALGGALTGLGGASLGLAVLGSFDGDPVAGRGFIALACVLLGRWRAPWVAAGALFFAMTDAFRFQTSLPGSETWGSVLPYVATLVALSLLQRKGSAGPRDEGRPLKQASALESAT